MFHKKGRASTTPFQPIPNFPQLTHVQTSKRAAKRFYAGVKGFLVMIFEI